MRTLTFGLVAAFALGLAVVSGPAMAECSWGHTKTADTGTPTIAEGQTQQTVKPDQGS
jgi:hypothetical protein